MLCGVIFAPYEVRAENDNSQNMTLLQSSVSLALAVDTKKNPEIIKNDAQVNVVSENALLPATSAVGADSEEADMTAEDINIYVVRAGDTYEGIAKMFDVSVNTILWANDLKKGDKLVPDSILIILPTSGVKHTVLKGQTLKTIAKLYDVDVSDITSFNDISIDADLNVGDELIIPGAEIKSIVSQPKKIKQGGHLPSLRDKDSQRSSAGYFIKPIPCELTQGRHDRTAVDISCHVSGTPIKAAASGRVILAKYGKNGGFGNVVMIQHPNGMQTLYAHQSKLNVSVGDQVSQGQIIGFVGSTGHSTGPHLHFEVEGGWNPGFDNSWAR